MTNILVYDTSEEKLEKLALEYDTTIAEIIEVLLDHSDDYIDEF